MANPRRPTRQEALQNQLRAWSLRMEGRTYSEIARELGVAPPSVHDMLRREYDRLRVAGGHESELETFRRQTKAGAAPPSKKPPRRAGLARVAVSSVYLAGQVVEVLGGNGGETSHTWVKTSRGARWSIPKEFLRPL